MIGKQTKGRGFRHLLDYLESRDDAKLIGGNMSGRNARELAKEFKLSRQLNPDAERVVYHVSLSAAKGDNLDDERWREIGDRYMKEMGFDANQFVIFRHHNTDDDHIHIAASRIRMDTGLVVHDSWDYVRSEKVLRQIEIDYNLVQVQGSREKLQRTPSTGQIRRIRREQEEYELGKLERPPGRTIKEELQQTIDRVSVDNPQMPILIWRLQLAGVSVRTGFTRNGKSKGISYEKDGQAFSGTQLGAAYTFPGLQKHLGVDYQPERDDARIEQLLKNDVPQVVENFQLINAIAQNIEQSVVESTLVETLPQLIDSLSVYQQQLEVGRTILDDLEAAITQNSQRLSSPATVDAIANFIEQSEIESTLVETLPQLINSLSVYQQQLKEGRTTLDDFRVAIAQHSQQLSSQKAVDAIANFIEHSVVESTLVETLPQLIDSLTKYQQLLAVKTRFDDLEVTITQQSQQLSSPTTVDAIAETKPHTLTPPQPKLTPNHIAELYQYYSADLHNLLVTDRDKEIAKRALLDNQPALHVEEIIKASPAGWTDEEAKALVLIANQHLPHLQEQSQHSPSQKQHLEKESIPAPTSPPPEDESLRPVLKDYLTQKRGLSNFLVEPLQRQGLGYLDQQRRVVFIKRNLKGEKSGALVWDTHSQDNRCMDYPEYSNQKEGWFHLKLGGKPDDKIERVFLCDSPIDALSIADMDTDAHNGLPPVKTMYMVVDDPDNLPLEVLKNISRIGLAFNNDAQGNKTASAVLELLPQSKRLPPDNQTWNQDLLERLYYEQEKRRQQQRGFSR